MEKVLYDIYLAEAEISSNYSIFSSDSTRKQELLNSVLKKHKITEAALDTSLAWYSGHLEKYLKINEKISERFAKKLETLQPAIISNVTASNLALPVEKERFLLRPYDLLNNSYSFKADTTLTRYGGAYELQLNILGIQASLRPVVTLCVRCTDTTLVKRDTISRNGLFVSSIDALQGKQAKALYGSIHFPEVSSGTTIFVHGFSLSHSSQPLSVAQPAK